MCSKSYKELRNNSFVYLKFLESVQKADAYGIYEVSIPIAKKHITFRQTHLAELQEVMKLKEE